MEIYRAETREILRRYRAGKISRRACVAALDAAVAGLVPQLRPEELLPLKALLEHNNKALVEVVTQRIRTNASLNRSN